MAGLEPVRRTSAASAPRTSSGRDPGQGAPPGREKPKGLPPALVFMIVIVAPLVLIVITFFTFMRNKEIEAKPAPVKEIVIDEMAALRPILEKDLPEAQRRYKELVKKRNEDPDGEFDQDIKDLRIYVQGVQKKLEDFFKSNSYRDPKTGALLNEYSGYQQYFNKLTELLYDLNRMTGF